MLANVVSLVDRQILSLMVEPIKRDLHVTDTQVGLLAGLAFAMFYSILGVPIARLSDRANRRNIILAGVFFWNLMAAGCGLARNYAQLFLARVGVGVGEAALSPAAYSMLADYFPPRQVARAISVYVMGIYLGTGLAMVGGSYIVRLAMDMPALTLPWIGELYSWQIAFLVSALIGLPMFALLLTVKEPARREYASDGSSHTVTSRVASWLEIRTLLRRRWKFFTALCVGSGCSGTVITAWLVWVPEVMRRTYDWNVTDAGVYYGVILMVFGMPGAYFGGWMSTVLAARQFRDAEMRSALWAVTLLLPFAVLVPLAPNATLMLVGLCPLIFLLSWPQGLAPAMVQLVAPNHMRAQLTAVFMLIAVLTGYTAGGALVAVVSQIVLRDEAALNIALSLVSGVFVPGAMLAFWLGLKHYAGARGSNESIVFTEVQQGKDANAI